MQDDHFWLSDSQFARLKPLLPDKVRGVPRVDDRRVISGIIHVIKRGLQWRDAPREIYGPHKTLYTRFWRWSEAGVFDKIFQALAGDGKAGDIMIDSAHLKAHRTAASLLKKGAYRGLLAGPKAA